MKTLVVAMTGLITLGFMGTASAETTIIKHRHGIKVIIKRHTHHHHMDGARKVIIHKHDR